MKKAILLIFVITLGLTIDVAKADFTFGEPTNLGPTVNSSAFDGYPDISADGLTLYFVSNRPGGSGGYDLWITTRPNINAQWGPAVNLGQPANSQ